jgi:hypothetical protein
MTVIIPMEMNPRESIALPAIYFLQPTEESVDQLVRDFTRKALYPSAHVFFSSALSKELEDKIVGCDILMDRLQTLKIINLEFVGASLLPLSHCTAPTSHLSVSSTPPSLSLIH